ncbi:MAG TPA: hypothetical protein VLA43_12030 [Longimicrobiales bacterium]|nr:hypothetical protein [Longimicrobiales bacterium]
MNRDFRTPKVGADYEGRDMELARLLEGVDPASADANYWLRFQSWVLKAAGPELARRRLMADLTMGEVLVGWARAVVPTAVAASLVAGFLLVRTAQARSDLAHAASVEELLVAGMEGQTIPVALVDDEADPSVTFAAERF